eukprot:2815187-Rhodomonas_salina.3
MERATEGERSGWGWAGPGTRRTCSTLSSAWGASPSSATPKTGPPPPSSSSSAAAAAHKHQHKHKHTHIRPFSSTSFPPHPPPPSLLATNPTPCSLTPLSLPTPTSNLTLLPVPLTQPPPPPPSPLLRPRPGGIAGLKRVDPGPAPPCALCGPCSQTQAQRVKRKPRLRTRCTRKLVASAQTLRSSLPAVSLPRTSPALTTSGVYALPVETLERMGLPVWPVA